MQMAFGVPSSYAGYVSMSISFMTIISALLSPRMIRRFHTKWIVIVSIFLTIMGLIGFSVSTSYWMLFLFVIPYGLGAGAIDASVNHYVANNFSGEDGLTLTYPAMYRAIIISADFCRCTKCLQGVCVWSCLAPLARMQRWI